MFTDLLHGSFAERLGDVERALSAGRPLSETADALSWDLWSVLLTKEYDGFDALKAALPDMPGEKIQLGWTGSKGIHSLRQAADFAKVMAAAWDAVADMPLGQARTLDYSCGWGRITRMIAKAIPGDRLFACDPLDQAVAVCQQLRVPGTIARSDELGRTLPFDGPFDLVTAFSVFTHLNEGPSRDHLRLIAEHMRPGGLAAITVRPIDFFNAPGPPIDSAKDEAARSRLKAEAIAGKFIFQRYRNAPSDVWGEAVIPPSYVERVWSEWFEILDFHILPHARFQILVTLRRR